MIDKIFNTRATLPTYEEYIKEISNIWENNWITSFGPKYKLLESKLQDFLEIEYVSLLMNGHSALELAIQAIGLSGEVITTPYTFISTTHAIVRNGLTPVYCDIQGSNFNIDVNKIEYLINENTSAIIPVHVYGNICDVYGIKKLADKYKLKVIYDGAHSFGEKFNGINVSNFGDATIYSFHASKVYNTIEGGCVATQNKNLKEKIDKLTNFGLNQNNSELIGMNAKMNEFSAAMGLCNLRNFETTINRRKHIIERYKRGLNNMTSLKFCTEDSRVTSNYSYLPIILKSPNLREFLYNELNRLNIQVLRNFYPIVTEHFCYEIRFKKYFLPVAKQLASRVLTLPLYEDLSIDEVDYIVDTMRRLIHNYNK